MRTLAPYSKALQIDDMIAEKPKLLRCVARLFYATAFGVFFSCRALK